MLERPDFVIQNVYHTFWIFTKVWIVVEDPDDWILAELERGRSAGFIQNVLSFKRPILLPGGICWIIRAGEPSTSQELYLHFKRQVLLNVKSFISQNYIFTLIFGY